MGTEKPRLSITFSPEEYEQLKSLAGIQKKPMAELVRHWTLQGISGDLNASNLDLITQILRTQIRDVLKPEMDRLATLNGKTCVQAGTAAYLAAEAILKFVPDHKQKEVEVAYEMARKKALAFLRNKENCL